ncbi:MAG TPA: tRNA uridine-5-carboxymethylaminomethyl(34) synthesis GTPase MnmE [Kiritimatiellia bacterium]|nr:tRNA uridine-5-carboxymethylaminomethyl(34) synthesis GTPase MnmE [Kiritimatiellia bacterium]
MSSVDEKCYSTHVIAAIATAAGPAGVSIVRVSGAGVLEVGDRLVPGLRCPPSQRAAGTFFHARVTHPVTGAGVDDAVFLIYRAPHSYTGEDTLEIQGHGGALPSRRLLEAVLAAGARLAEPGEFTRRAFLNGRMDLTQAEAVCDLIQSRTERAAHVARAQLDGALGGRVASLYDAVTAVCAEVEHLLDFDEGELPPLFTERASERLTACMTEMEQLAASWHEGHLIREGALVVLAGRPNVGKSSLMNALLGTRRAIVHDLPGTTRDAIEESLVLYGVPLRLVDTAGLRDAQDGVEREGVERARAVIHQADLILYLVDGSVPQSETLDEVCAAFPAGRVMVVVTKCDLPAAAPLEIPPELAYMRVSAKSGEGLEALKRMVAETLGVTEETYGQPIVSLRHITELRTALEQSQEARAALDAGESGLVLAAGHLRGAAEALGRMIGRVYTEDLLDTIFSRFCVGK